MFMKSYHKLCLDNRLEKYPLFWSPVGRLAKTLKPSTVNRDYRKEKKKASYREQAAFITRYLIGKKIREDQRRQIDEI